MDTLGKATGKYSVTFPKWDFYNHIGIIYHNESGHIFCWKIFSQRAVIVGNGISVQEIYSMQFPILRKFPIWENICSDV